MNKLHYALIVGAVAVAVPAAAALADTAVNSNLYSNLNSNVNSMLNAHFNANAHARSDVRSDAAPAVSVNAETNIDVLTNTALKLVDQRVAALAKLKAAVNANARLNVDQKSTLNAQIDADVNGLNTIARDVRAGGMDAAQLRAKINSIYSDFRVYAVFIPKMQLEAALDAQLNFAGSLDAAFADAQATIDASAHAGADVTAAQKALNDAKAKRADAVAKLNATFAAVAGVTPADYPDKSASVFADARAQVKVVSGWFGDIRVLLKAAVTVDATARAEAIRAARAKFQAAIHDADVTFRADVAAARAKMQASKASARADLQAELDKWNVKLQIKLKAQAEADEKLAANDQADQNEQAEMNGQAGVQDQEDGN